MIQLVEIFEAKANFSGLVKVRAAAENASERRFVDIRTRACTKYLRRLLSSMSSVADRS